MDREGQGPGWTSGWTPDPPGRSGSPPDPPGGDVPDVVGVSERLVALELERRRVEAEIAVLVDAVDRSGVHREDGHRSVNGWVRTHSRCSDVEITDRRRVGRLARADARFADAIGSGRIGVAQARRMARAFANPRCGAELLDGELLDTLLAHAANLPFAEFCRVVDLWERLADADGAEQSAAAAHDGRDAHVSVVADEIVIHAHGGLAHGAVIADVFATYCDAEFAVDWEQNRSIHGDDATAATMPRSDAQRRFDALYRICVEPPAAPAPGLPSRW